MSIVTIILNNRNFQLYCDSGTEEELAKLSETLNEKLINLKMVNPTASFELLLIMTALSMQDQLQNLQSKLNKLTGTNNIPEEEKFAETLSTIAGYLENLAQKISK